MAVPIQHRQGHQNSVTGSPFVQNTRNGQATIAGVQLDLGLGHTSSRSGYNQGPKTSDTAKAHLASANTPTQNNVIIGGEHGGYTQWAMSFVSMVVLDNDIDCPDKQKQIENHGMEYLPQCGGPVAGDIIDEDTGRPVQLDFPQSSHCCDENRLGPCKYHYKLNNIDEKYSFGDDLMNRQIASAEDRKRIIVNSITAFTSGASSFGCTKSYPKGSAPQWDCPEAAALIRHTGTFDSQKIVANKKLVGEAEIRNTNNWDFDPVFKTGDYGTVWVESEWIWAEGSNLDKVLKCIALGGTNKKGYGATPGCNDIALAMSSSTLGGIKNLFNVGVPVGTAYSCEDTCWYAIKITSVTAYDEYAVQVFTKSAEPPIVKVVVDWQWGKVCGGKSPCPITTESNGPPGFDPTSPTAIYPTNIVWQNGTSVVFTSRGTAGASGTLLDCPDISDDAVGNRERRFVKRTLDCGVNINFSVGGGQWWEAFNPENDSGKTLPYIAGTYAFSPPKWGSMVSDTMNDRRCGGGSFSSTIRDLLPKNNWIHEHRDVLAVCKCPRSFAEVYGGGSPSAASPNDNCDYCSTICCDTDDFPDDPAGNLTSSEWDDIKLKNGSSHISLSCVCYEKEELDRNCGCNDATSDTTAPIVTASAGNDPSMCIIHLHWATSPTEKDLSQIIIRWSTSDNIVNWMGAGNIIEVNDVDGHMGDVDIDVNCEDEHWWAVFAKDKDGNYSLLSDEAKGYLPKNLVFSDESP